MKQKNEVEQLIELMIKYSKERLENHYSIYNIVELKNIRKMIIEKASFLVKMIDKHGNPFDITTKATLLSIIAHCYNDEGKYLLMKNGLLTDKWEYGKIQNCDNKYLKKILMKSISYFEKSIELYKKIANEPRYYELNDNMKFEYNCGIRVSYGDIARIYYSLNNDEKFLEYADYAILYNSLNIISLVIKYYCDVDDFDNAFFYYKKSENIEIPYDTVNITNVLTNETSKYNCGIWFCNYLISLKKYELASEVIDNTKTNIINAKSIPLDYCLQNLQKRKRICQYNLENGKKKITSNKSKILSKYFTAEIIDQMNSNIKIYISTSIEIYDYLNGLEYDLDYSSSLISIMKALESLLYEIIANNYLCYLKSVPEIDFNKIDRSLKSEKAKVFALKDTINRIEYGTVINIISKRNPNDFNERIIYDYFYDFYTKGMPEVDNAKHVLSIFLEKLEDLKDKRNNVAHKDPFSKEDAQHCIRELIEDHVNFISYIYNNFSFCYKK